ARLRRRCLRKPGLVRGHLPRDRSGPDCLDDRERADGAAVETLHGSARSAERASQARLLEPSPGRRRNVTETLEQWLADELRHAVPEMLKCISACDIVKVRPGLRQTVRPIAGSIVASPVLGAYDPDPDYFFHWFRDSAIVID